MSENDRVIACGLVIAAVCLMLSHYTVFFLLPAIFGVTMVLAGAYSAALERLR